MTTATTPLRPSAGTRPARRSEVLPTPHGPDSATTRASPEHMRTRRAISSVRPWNASADPSSYGWNPLIHIVEAVNNDAGRRRFCDHRGGSALPDIRLEHLRLFVIVRDDDLAVMCVRRRRREEALDQVGDLFVRGAALDGGQRVHDVTVVDHRQEADAPAVLHRPQIPRFAGLG